VEPVCVLVTADLPAIRWWQKTGGKARSQATRDDSHKDTVLISRIDSLVLGHMLDKLFRGRCG
jgi:hypothetical protein